MAGDVLPDPLQMFILHGCHLPFIFLMAWDI
jgi:hypothetical protein